VNGFRERRFPRIRASQHPRRGNATAMRWTQHVSSSGKPFYYSAETGSSVWDRPDGFDAPEAPREPPSLRSCLG